MSAQVDPTGHWRTLETAHFDVHVRAEDRAVGLRAAGEAEAAYAAYALFLPAPHGRIDLVVADNIDDPNGYASTYPTPRIVIFALPPAGDPQLEAYDRWLRLVITHELAHVFHLDLARGWWAAARSVFGRAPFLFPNNYSPPWMREGLAVFYESRLTGAGRLEGSYFRAITAAAAAEGHGMPIDEASTASPRWPAGLRAYAFGSQFMGVAAGRSGDSVIARAALETARMPIPYLQLSAAWRNVTGVSLGPAWEEQDAPARRRADAQGGMTLLPGLRSTVPPRLSPDGARLFVAYDDGRDAMRLVAIDRARGARRRIARLNGVTGLAVSQGGEAIVSQLEYTDLYTLRADLWAIAPRGKATRLTRGARLREPDVAADGAIVAVRAVPGGTELVLQTASRQDGKTASENAEFQVIGASEPGVEWASPRFDPATGNIAAVRVERGWHDIVLLNRAGAITRRITRDSIADLMPAFTSDGRWLVWSREVRGTPQIVGLRQGADSSDEAVQFTDEPFAAYAPAPANDTLYYLSYHADGFHLVSGPLTGTPWSLPALADLTPATESPAPEAALRDEHPYRALASARPRYWLPLVFAEPGGTWLGAFTSGVDALGRHTYVASLAAGLGSLAGQWNGQLAYLFAGPGHALLDGSLHHDPHPYQIPAGAGGPSSPAQIGCCDPDEELDAGLTLVRRRWRSQALLRFGAEYTRDLRAERVGGSLSAALAHTITPPLSISTQQGARLAATLRYRHRSDQDLSSTEIVVRGSLYHALAVRRFARRVIALHAAYGVAGGNDPTDFSVGGVSGGAVTLLPGVTLGAGSRTFPVRGYQAGALAGRRALAGSIEFREPLALVGRGLGLFPLGLDRLSAALFVDGGMAWANQYCPQSGAVPGGAGAPVCASRIASLGAELSTDLAVTYDFPLRVRFGWAWGFGVGAAFSTSPAAYATVGSSF